MYWTFLGAGAVGSLFATQLDRMGVPVQFIDPRTTESHPFACELTTLTHESYQANLIVTTQFASTSYLLVTTKVWQIEDALTSLKGHIPSYIPIILIHNGMGISEWVQRHFPENPLIACVTSVGAYKPHRHAVRHCGFGETWLGALNPAGEQFKPDLTLLNQALGHAQWCNDIEDKQWRKLVVNAVINPLTSTLNMKNGELIHHVDTIASLCDELAKLLLTVGFQESAEEWQELVMRVISRTAENYSSMQQDICHQRKTEIEFITGHILRQAAKYDLAMPRHHQLYRDVVALESCYLSENERK